jgi:hemolysin-activating ACP:hemolysin acyltransferase
MTTSIGQLGEPKGRFSGGRDNKSREPVIGVVADPGFALGNAVWLMSLSEQHRDRSVEHVRRWIMTPIHLGTYAILKVRDVPFAFFSYGMFKPTSLEMLSRDAYSTELIEADWTAGEQFVLTEVVSPNCDSSKLTAHIRKRLSSEYDWLQLCDRGLAKLE